VVDFSKKDY